MKLTERTDFDIKPQEDGKFSIRLTSSMDVAQALISRESLVAIRELIDGQLGLPTEKEKQGLSKMESFSAKNSPMSDYVTTTQSEEIEVFYEYFPSVITDPSIFLKMQDYMEENKRVHLYNQRHGVVLGVLVRDATGSYMNPGLSKENEMGLLFRIPKKGYEHLRSGGKVELNSLNNNPEVIYFLVRTRGPACVNFIDKYFGGKVSDLNGDVFHTKEESGSGPYKILRTVQRNHEDQLSTVDNYIPAEVYLDRDADIAWLNENKEEIKRALSYVIEEGGL